MLAHFFPPQLPTGSLVTKVLPHRKACGRLLISILYDLISSWVTVSPMGVRQKSWKEAIIRVNSTSSCSCDRFSHVAYIRFILRKLVLAGCFQAQLISVIDVICHWQIIQFFFFLLSKDLKYKEMKRRVLSLLGFATDYHLLLRYFSKR